MTVDIVFHGLSEELKVLLVKRGVHRLKTARSPRCFLNEDESLDEAAMRELREGVTRVTLLCDPTQSRHFYLDFRWLSE